MHIKHKDTSIFYTDDGSGEAIILLHGFLENKEMWKSFVPPLSINYRVITIDLPGHGTSESLEDLHSMKFMAETVLAVLDVLKITHGSFLGHSMGGYVGLAFAKLYSHKVKALCLLNSSTDADTKSRKQLREKANKMAKCNYDQLVRISVFNLFNLSAKSVYKNEMIHFINEALRTPLQGYIAGNSGMRMRPDYFDIWKSSRFKKGVILGSHDPIINATNQEKKLKKYSDLFSIFDGGHLLHITNTSQTLRTFLKFLDL